MRKIAIVVLLVASLSACGSDGGDGNNVIINGPRFVDNGDGTILDNQTGLMWEKKFRDSGIHNADSYYTWSAQTETGLETLPDGTVFTEFLATLNTPPCFARYCDWRLPTVTELESILAEPCMHSPCVLSVFHSSCSMGCSETECSCTYPWPHWSATTITDNPTDALSVNFFSGGRNRDDKSHGLAARAVRLSDFSPLRRRLD